MTAEVVFLMVLFHFWGDYLLQSDWMSIEKTKRWKPAVIHALIYSLAFLVIANITAVLTILVSHLLIDRFRLVKYLLRVKEWRWKAEWGYITTEKEAEYYTQQNIKAWKECKGIAITETPKPVWMWVWLMIISDNTIHITINYLAIRYLNYTIGG